MNRPAIVACIIALMAVLGCSDTKNAPKGIDADGTVYIACRGFVTISGNMQQGYEVRFTDANGLDHDVRGIHKLEVQDLPNNAACGAVESKASNESKEKPEPQKDVNEACKQARANGTAMKWNEKDQKFDINPVCEE